jgi:hypothetical protein
MMPKLADRFGVRVDDSGHLLWEPRPKDLLMAIEELFGCWRTTPCSDRDGVFDARSATATNPYDP